MFVIFWSLFYIGAITLLSMIFVASLLIREVVAARLEARKNAAFFRTLEAGRRGRRAVCHACFTSPCICTFRKDPEHGKPVCRG